MNLIKLIVTVICLFCIEISTDPVIKSQAIKLTNPQNSTKSEFNPASMGSWYWRGTEDESTPFVCYTPSMVGFWFSKIIGMAGIDDMFWLQYANSGICFYVNQPARIQLEVQQGDKMSSEEFTEFLKNRMTTEEGNAEVKNWVENSFSKLIVYNISFKDVDTDFSEYSSKLWNLAYAFPYINSGYLNEKYSNEDDREEFTFNVYGIIYKSLGHDDNDIQSTYESQINSNPIFKSLIKLLVKKLVEFVLISQINYRPAFLSEVFGETGPRVESFEQIEANMITVIKSKLQNMNITFDSISKISKDSMVECINNVILCDKRYSSNFNDRIKEKYLNEENQNDELKTLFDAKTLLVDMYNEIAAERSKKYIEPLISILAKEMTYRMKPGITCNKYPHIYSNDPAEFLYFIKRNVVHGNFNVNLEADAYFLKTVKFNFVTLTNRIRILI